MRRADAEALRRLDFIPFPEELVHVKREFTAYAREKGLDPGEVIFDFLTPAQISEVASYDGFPGRYPHWRFGMAFDQQEKSHAWGLSTIYEMVINNQPCYAYLLEGSSKVVQRMVIAHVLGHADFFRHNAYFAGTNRNMLNEMANHSARVRRYSNRYGFERVERFLDTCLSLENLVDPELLFRQRAKEKEAGRRGTPEPESAKAGGPRFTSPYLDSYVRTGRTPPSPLKGKEGEPEQASLKPFPEKPERAVLDFLVDYAPLEDWERDILDITRDEAYYFLPQRLTKIMNEGWAVFWHTRIMVARGLAPSEIVQYADEHSKIVAPWRGGLNPYRLGVSLFEDIKERWDTGRHGPEWEACDDLRRRERWDTREGKGMEKVFEVRSAFNDAQFVDGFLTRDFVDRHRLFTYRLRPREGSYAVESREFQKVKETLLLHLANGGEPILEVVDANHRNRSELLLRHRHGGVDLKIQEARQTLRALYAVWRRPVNLQTIFQGKEKTFTFDGQRESEG
jgi:stage V sporulation protein R